MSNPTSLRTSCRFFGGTIMLGWLYENERAADFVATARRNGAGLRRQGLQLRRCVLGCRENHRHLLPAFVPITPKSGKRGVFSLREGMPFRGIPSMQTLPSFGGERKTAGMGARFDVARRNLPGRSPQSRRFAR